MAERSRLDEEIVSLLRAAVIEKGVTRVGADLRVSRSTISSLLSGTRQPTSRVRESLTEHM